MNKFIMLSLVLLSACSIKPDTIEPVNITPNEIKFKEKCIELFLQRLPMKTRIKEIEFERSQTGAMVVMFNKTAHAKYQDNLGAICIGDIANRKILMSITPVIGGQPQMFEVLMDPSSIPIVD